MGTCSNRFRHIYSYSGITEHILTYSGIDIFRTLCNHGVLRTLIYLEPDAYSKSWQRSTKKPFVKTANKYNHLHKLKLLLQYQVSTFSTLWNECHDFFNADI